VGRSWIGLANGMTRDLTSGGRGAMAGEPAAHHRAAPLTHLESAIGACSKRMLLQKDCETGLLK